MTDETDFNDDYCDDSGPFCRHWAEPGMCDKICARCGHGCTHHDLEGPCDEQNCNCIEFMDDLIQPHIS